ncbi:MAG: CDP-alcohol phosphatidyltransferase family protein [Candidatus Eiseniibacteriota bacterium]
MADPRPVESKGPGDRPGAPGTKPADAERQAKFIVARFEQWALPRLAARLPKWVLPDHLTGLGIVAATGIMICYMLSNDDPLWLWGANLGLVLHWFGDSLDGTLARVRKIQRPRYGFYLDHLTDAYSTTVLGLGLGFSPYMLLAVALAGVAAYLVLSINVYLETYIFGVFRYGYGVLGPTEARILLIVLNILALFVSPLPFTIGKLTMTAFDIGGIAVCALMFGLLLRRALRNLGELAKLEPPNVVKE